MTPLTWLAMCLPDHIPEVRHSEEARYPAGLSSPMSTNEKITFFSRHSDLGPFGSLPLHLLLPPKP